MKLKKFAPQKNSAQAIVEFAIVLPILLLLLYGLLETGRLLFMYSSVVTASRQAARYGSATGMGEDWQGEGGPDNSTIPRYQDCYGIRRAAERADYLNAFNGFDNLELEIHFDNGEGVHPPAPFDDTCDGQRDTNITPSDQNNTRIVVTVNGRFNSIVPSLSNIIPFFKRPIRATSARTILVAVSIQVAHAGSATPTVNLSDSSVPMGGTPPGVTQPGDPFTITATVNGSAGPAAGTVTFSFNGVAICTDVGLVNGTADCPMTLPFPGGAITVDFTPTDPDVYSAASGTIMHTVGPADTITTVVDMPNQTLPDGEFVVSVLVTSAGSTPTGTVAISMDGGANCTITLVNGMGSCPNTFAYSAVGNYTISAAYTPGDFEHKPSTGSTVHQVVTVIQPPTNTPVPPTAIPTTPAPPSVTPVPGCSYIRDNTGVITISGKTMYLILKNTGNNYPVTVSSVFVAWNYDKGHATGQTSLYLQKADANGTVFWTGNLNQPSALLPLSTAVTVPANGTLKITFTFDKIYDGPRGSEQVQVQFSTPGCQDYPVVRPAGMPTITPVTNANLKVQLTSGGTDGTTETQFWFRVQNSGTGPGTNISVRIYFQVDPSLSQTDYGLDITSVSPAPVATVTGPTLLSGKVYYYTISYGSASLPIGGTWTFQARLHGTSGKYDATNDWWHTSGALPGSGNWPDWTTIPVYVGTNRVWGTEPP